MKKVMTVEDDNDTRKVIKLILEKEGYKIIEARDGKECLKKLKKETPDLILMDIMMPCMSGWDTITKIKKNKKWNKIKICFLSVVEASKERKKALVESGVQGYIMKPFEKKQLINEVKRLLQ